MAIGTSCIARRLIWKEVRLKYSLILSGDILNMSVEEMFLRLTLLEGLMS